MSTENPTLQTEVNGQPFLITGEFEALQSLETIQKRQYAIQIAKTVLSAPFKAVAHVAGRVGAELEVDIHDKIYGTNFREVITAERLKRKHEAKAKRISQKLFDNPDLIVPKH